MDPPRRRRVDASAGREVVFCHSCQGEWYRDEHGLRCPNCQGEITEIITLGRDDPRNSDPLRELRRFDRSPHPYQHHHHHHHHHPEDSDPEEDYRDEDIRSQPQPGLFMHSTLFGLGPRPGNGNRAANSPNPNLNSTPNTNPMSPLGVNASRSNDADGSSVLRRFQEMLQNDFQVGNAGRSGRDTLFPDPPAGASSPSMFQRQMSYTSGRGGVTMSFTLGGGAGGGSVGSPPPLPFDQMFNSMMDFPPHAHAGPGIPPPPGAANNASQRVGQDLAGILAALLGTIGNANGVHGDGVYTQEALDRIVSQLMEQNQGSSAPPPATQGAMDNLPRKTLDKEMLPEGTGECTICIQDVTIGDEVVSLSCGHWFHEDCILHWLRQHGTCPICRKTVDPAAGQAPSSNLPPPSVSAAGPGRPGPSPVPGSGPGLGPAPSPQQPHQSAQFTFFTTSSSAGNGGPSASMPRARASASAEARLARLNAIRNLHAPQPPAQGAAATGTAPPSLSSSNRMGGVRTHRSRSRSPPRLSNAEQRRRSPSSQSRRSSLFTSNDRGNREGNRERDRSRRASHLPSSSSRNRGPETGTPNGSGRGSSGSGGNNSNPGPFMGWLRNQFQGRRS